MRRSRQIEMTVYDYDIWSDRSHTQPGVYKTSKSIAGFKVVKDKKSYEAQCRAAKGVECTLYSIANVVIPKDSIIVVPKPHARRIGRNIIRTNNYIIQNVDGNVSTDYVTPFFHINVHFDLLCQSEIDKNIDNACSVGLYLFARKEDAIFYAEQFGCSATD